MALMSDQCRNRWLAVAKIVGKTRKTVPQGVWRHICGQFTELRNAGPKLWKSKHSPRTASSDKNQLAGVGKTAQHIAGSVG